MNNKYTVGDLFAGAGGLSNAFQQAGAEIVWANELDRDACNLYRENFSNVCLFECDIKEVKTENIPNIDIIVGGFPFKTFSTLKIKNGFHDERGNLFFEFLRILKEKKPKAFLLESVKVLQSHNHDNTFKKITSQLEDEGYYIKYEVLNSIEYGNIPHKKERMYIVGFKDAKDYKMFQFPKKIQLVKEIRDFIDVKQCKEDKYYCKGSKYYTKFKEFIVRKDMIYELSGGFTTNKKVLEEYNICPMLKSYMRNTEYVPLINDGYDIRRLTPRELFNFQGFFDIQIPTLISEKNCINMLLYALL